MPSNSFRALHEGDQAPDVKLLNTTGEEVSLSSFWSSSDHGVAVVFLRHFGCIFCRDHVVRLRKEYARFEEVNLPIIAIGLGSAKDAKGFQEWLKVPFTILAAPDTDAHAAYGLGKAGIKEMLNPSVVVAGVKALGNKVMQGKPTGDPAQLAGTFLVDKAGIVQWANPSEHPGDLAKTDDILQAARRLEPAKV